jgi:hypothetical protein
MTALQALALLNVEFVWRTARIRGRAQKATISGRRLVIACEQVWDDTQGRGTKRNGDYASVRLSNGCRLLFSSSEFLFVGGREMMDTNQVTRRQWLWRFGGGLGGIALTHLLGARASSRIRRAPT